MSKQQLAKVGGGLPMERPTWMTGAGRGNEGVTTDDMTLPRLSIIQDLSPQHKKGKPEYIEGAETKMIFNTATNELYGERVFVVPVMFRKEWIVWKDINKGGGFKGAYPTQAEAMAAMSELDDASDCEVVDTAQHFCLVIPASAPVAEYEKHMQQAVVSMSKSQMKVSRQWNTLIQTTGGDRWERLYELSVVDDQNAAGNEYYNWKVKQMGYVTEEVFIVAEKLYESIRSGKVDVKRDQESPSGHAQGEVTDQDDF